MYLWYLYQSQRRQHYTQIPRNGCIGLTEITIANTVTSIERAAFKGRTKLVYIIAPAQFTGQTADFWRERGVDVNRTDHIWLTKFDEKHSSTDKGP